MELVLVRHAEPSEDARGRCYGSLDIGLSPVGATQCRVLAAGLTHEPLRRVVSSPSTRALETARAIAAAHRLGVEIDDRLRELDFGDIEGRTYEEISVELPELYRQWMERPTDTRFPGGEAYADLRERARSFVASLEIAHQPGTVAAVTHAGFVRCVVAEILDLPAERVFRLAVDPASITRVAWMGHEPVLRLLNGPPEAARADAAAQAAEAVHRSP